jgi:diguanylate cyclase (GGDEF)-like protein
MKSEPIEQATILVVDDTPANLQVILKHLAEKGFRLLVARNGEAALKQAMISTPDLILLDVMMPPGIDGFETCRRLKQQDALKDIPVIFLTALSDSINKVKGIEAGGVDYISKPFDGAEVLARVNTHLALHYYRKALEQTNRELQQANETLVHSRKKFEVAVRTDALTELPNRRDMLDKLEYEKIRVERRQKPFAVALCDIDYFKQINDRFGHDCGDAVLVAVARLMRSMIRKQDLVARWGGEEFLFVLPETDAQGGRTVCEKIRITIEQHTVHYNEHKLSVTVTFGVSVFDDYEKSVDQPVREAEQALYHGKQRGRNRVALFGKKMEKSHDSDTHSGS